MQIAKILELMRDERPNPNRLYVNAGLGDGRLDNADKKLTRPSEELVFRVCRALLPSTRTTVGTVII